MGSEMCIRDRIIVSIAGVLFHRSEIELMVIELFSISAMNIGAVRII